MSKVVTRIAPSPTGYMHIGTARTALFNWLYAKHNGGQFLLRIEDTDRARSTDAAVYALIDGLKWLGLEWDGDVVFQFARMKRHAEVAKELLAADKAYYCTCTPEDLDKMRAAQKEKGEHVGYDRRCRNAGHTAGAVRIKAPDTEGEMLVKDAVQGDVHVPYTQLDDMVLLRSDGTPVYMLSVVVDDRDMGITHVIRGDDHLTNTFRQRLIYDAMGWEPPVFAHLPLIHGPDGAKLSKRHGAVGLETYKDMGYLPEAVRNYLLRLGWGHGDTEIISTEDAIKIFALEDIGRAPSRMDYAKLASVNAHYMRACDEGRLFELLVPFIEKELGGKPSAQSLTWVSRGLHGLKERASTLIELAQGALFYVHPRPLPLDEKAVQTLDADARTVLKEIAPLLAGLPDFTATALEAALKDYATQKGLKLGKVAMPLRCALTGSTNSPSVFHVAEILGRDESLARLGDIK